MTPERAEELCREDIGHANGVSGVVGVGVGTNGARAKGAVVVTNRVFNPQTEEEFLRDCIDRKLGQAPAETTFSVAIGGSF